MSDLLQRRKRESTKIISFHIPPHLLKMIDELVEQGVFTNRSAAIRYFLAKGLAEWQQIMQSRAKMVVGYR